MQSLHHDSVSTMIVLHTKTSERKFKSNNVSNQMAYFINYLRERNFTANSNQIIWALIFTPHTNSLDKRSLPWHKCRYYTITAAHNIWLHFYYFLLIFCNSFPRPHSKKSKKNPGLRIMGENSFWSQMVPYIWTPSLHVHFERMC